MNLPLKTNLTPTYYGLLLHGYGNQDKKHKKNKKKIVYSIYHVEDTSEESIELAQLRKIEEFVDAFHVISRNKRNFNRINKNQYIFYLSGLIKTFGLKKITNQKLRKNMDLIQNIILLGVSKEIQRVVMFVSPKLVKGPDIFLEIVNKLYEKNKNISIVLTGTRRKYIISELNKKNTI